MTRYVWNAATGTYTTASDWTPNGVPLGSGDIADVPFGIVTLTATGLGANVLTGVTVELGGSTQTQATLSDTDVGFSGTNGGVVFLQNGGETTLSVQGRVTFGAGTVFSTRNASTGPIAISIADSGADAGSLVNSTNAVFTGSNTTIRESQGTTDATFDNLGTLNIVGGVATISVEVIGTGKITLQGAATLTLGTVLSQQTVEFDDRASTIKLSTPGTFKGVVNGFFSGDHLVVSGTAAHYVYSAGVLSLTDASGNAIFQAVVNVPSTTGFALSAANGVTTVSSNAVSCFVAGTRITAMQGEIAVERLAPGDLVRSALSGRWVPVRWIGRRRVESLFHADPLAARPVRLRAGCLGGGVPVRELRLSPEHGLLLDGAIVPARCLLDGVSVTQEGDAAVDYFHIELNHHDAVLAEGAAAESWLDTGNRAMFGNAEAGMAGPGGTAEEIWAELACAPLLESGPALDCLRARLGLAAYVASRAICREPELAIEADGEAVMGERDGVTWRFRASLGARQVRLRSRAGIPFRLGESGDARTLGIAVGTVGIAGRAIPLAALPGDGWHAPEAEGHRWTSGDAWLPPGGGDIVVTVESPGWYAAPVA